MSPAEICYAYKLLNHLCESTMELLVNKLIRNQVEYLLNNEVNKQLFNWIHLTLSTSCAKNEAIPVVNTSKSEHNSVLQFYETSPTVTEEKSKTNNAVLSRSMSSDSCPMDLSQKVSSSSHFDRSRELINNDSSRLANVQRRNEYNCGTQKNDRRRSQNRDNNEDTKSNDVIDPTNNPNVADDVNYSGQLPLIITTTATATTYKKSHEVQHNKCPTVTRNRILRSQNKNLITVRNLVNHPGTSSEHSPPKPPVENPLRYEHTSNHLTGIIYNRPAGNYNGSNSSISSAFTKISTTDNTGSSITLLRKNVNSVFIPSGETFSVTTQAQYNEGNDDMVQQEQQSNVEDIDDKMNEVKKKSKRRRHPFEVIHDEMQNCSTCELSFKDPIDFFKHIQMVHVGLGFVEGINSSNFPKKMESQNHKRSYPETNDDIDNGDDDDDGDGDDNDDDMEEDIDEYTPVKLSLYSTRQTPYEFRRIKKKSG
ncbi:unnamed protein product [Heterobilharzia americana]|nr:unnamed protein product [Heterobilharzia americana]